MEQTKPRRSRSAVFAMSLTIGTLIVAAVVGGYFIIVGDQAGIAGRVWLTLFLLAAFVGAVSLDAAAGHGPNRWYLAASTVVNILLVIIGLLKLWNGWLQPANTASAYVWSQQIALFLGIVFLVRLGLFIIQLYILHFVTRGTTAVIRGTAVATVVLLAVTVIVLVVPMAFPEPAWPDWWWRIAGATSLAAAISAIIPVVVRAFEPKPETPAAQYPGAAGPGFSTAPYQTPRYPAPGQYPQGQQLQAPPSGYPVQPAAAPAWQGNAPAQPGQPQQQPGQWPQQPGQSQQFGQPQQWQPAPPQQPYNPQQYAPQPPQQYASQPTWPQQPVPPQQQAQPEAPRPPATPDEDAPPPTQ
ncbi:hypothetical protein KXS11_11875 [Plantibacter flavus]|uniref:hypothetical protein n=1 Tax=Plantibacter flavus TaxID=150123 RepID=UPI003F1665FB